MDSVLESAMRVKSVYGEKCKILRQQGDYEVLVKVEFKKMTVHIAVSSEFELDIFIRGCDDQEFQSSLENALKELANTQRIVAIDELVSLADRLITDHAADQSDHPSTSAESNTTSTKTKTKAKKLEKSEIPPSKSSMKTASDVISRIKWDPNLQRISQHIRIGYLDRFVGIVEKPFSEFNWTDDFVDVDMENDFSVPQHRIQYFKYKNAILWDKKERFDAIFNSAGCKISIDDIIRSEDENMQ